MLTHGQQAQHTPCTLPLLMREQQVGHTVGILPALSSMQKHGAGLQQPMASCRCSAHHLCSNPTTVSSTAWGCWLNTEVITPTASISSTVPRAVGDSVANGLESSSCSSSKAFTTIGCTVTHRVGSCAADSGWPNQEVMS